MTEVVPAILPESLTHLDSEMSRVKGLVDRVQIDIANGSYAPSTTWPFNDGEGFAELVSGEKGLPFWRELDVELDMLVMEPDQYIESWITAGISSVVIHIETTENYSQILKNLGIAGVGVGWGMKPNTENEKLFDIIDAYGEPHFIQVMGNDRIGYHGVELDSRVYDKVRAIRDEYAELPIAVDIGVNEETAPKLVEAGVTKLVSGSAIFGADDIEKAIEHFEALSV